MADWVEVDWEKLNQPRSEKINGIEVTVYFSPYDMPEEVKGEYRDTDQRFAIQFRYLGGEEPIDHRDADKYVRLGIGRETKRLHEILVDVTGLRADRVFLKMQPSVLGDEVADEVKKVITEFAEASPPGAAPMGNYAAASEVLTQQREQVYSALAGACG
jgi:hypothetical protein